MKLLCFERDHITQDFLAFVCGAGSIVLKEDVSLLHSVLLLIQFSTGLNCE
jgi:hypothetical protein